jgi:muramoyltetrapeptide carboxypeptidase
MAGVLCPGLAFSRPALPLIKPPRLREGELVGLIAPGGAMTDEEVERATRNIEGMGLRVKHGANIRLRRGNYAGTSYQQVEDLHGMFLDREVKAVWSGRGGSGGSLMLPLLDYKLIRAHPKVFVGFSDTTALHLGIARHARLVTFHGPAGISTFSPYSVAHMRAVFMEPRPTFTVAPNTVYPEKTIHPGVAIGPLMGGNLSVLTALGGSPYEALFEGTIAFFEDVSEAPYRVNRMLAQLVLAGRLPRAAGVMLGICAKCTTAPDEPGLTMDETVVDRIQPLKLPSAYGFSFGHIREHFTIPLGIRARLDATERTLTFLEPAVT